MLFLISQNFISLQLEEQVSDLKKRLEELRKAKSTTIIKKDKTYVASGAPHKLCDNATKRTAELHDSHRQGTASLESTEKNEERSQQDVENQQDYIARLKEMHRAEIEELRKEVEKQVTLMFGVTWFYPLWPVAHLVQCRATMWEVVKFTLAEPTRGVLK